jgi:hypothetical protein
MVIGGQSSSGHEKTVEILDENGWQLSTINSFPVTITASCAVLIGPNKVMVTGGIQNASKCFNCLHQGFLAFEVLSPLNGQK